MLISHEWTSLYKTSFNSMSIKTLKHVWDAFSSTNTDSVWCKGVHYQTSMFVSITTDHSFRSLWGLQSTGLNRIVTTSSLRLSFNLLSSRGRPLFFSTPQWVCVCFVLFFSKLVWKYVEFKGWKYLEKQLADVQSKKSCFLIYWTIKGCFRSPLNTKCICVVWPAL